MDNVFYHGTNYEIKKFSDEFAGKVGPDAEGPGIYFTNSKENAMMWGKLIYKVILNPRKTITNQKTSHAANKKDLKKLLDIKGEDYILMRTENVELDKIMAINEAIKYSETEDEVYHSIRQEQYSYAPQNFMRNMTKIGIDALILYKKGFEFNDVNKVFHCLVYNPEIINIVDVEKVNDLSEVKKVIKNTINKLFN